MYLAGEARTSLSNYSSQHFPLYGHHCDLHRRKNIDLHTCFSEGTSPYSPSFLILSASYHTKYSWASEGESRPVQISLILLSCKEPFL